MNRLIQPTLTIALLVLPRAAQAQQAHPDVDIESLKGTLYRSAGEWLLDVRYDVEIEGYLPAEPLELLLTITEDGYELADPQGRPLQYAEKLDRPTEVDDDELEFERRLTVGLPDGAFSDPHDLRLHGAVFYPGDYDRPLDTKNKSIDYKRSYVKTYIPTASVSYGKAYYGPAYYGAVRYSPGCYIRPKVHYSYGVRHYPKRYSHRSFGIGVHVGKKHHFGRSYSNHNYGRHYGSYRHGKRLAGHKQIRPNYGGFRRR